MPRFFPLHHHSRLFSVVAGTLMAAALTACSTGELPQTYTGGLLLVVNKGENTVTLIEVPEGTEVARIEVGFAPHEVAVSPDGRLAVVTDYGTGRQPGSTLTVIDLAERLNVGTIDLQEQRRPHGIVFLPDGRTVVVTTEGTGTLTLVDVEHRQVLAAVPTGQRVSHQVAVTPDGRLAFVANIGSGSVTVIDLTRREVIRSIPTGAGAEGVAVTPDGSQVWITNRSADTVTVLDAARLEVLATIPSASFPIRVVFTPDGERALVTNARSGHLRIFDVASRQEMAVISMEIDGTTMEGRIFQFEGSAVPIGMLVTPDSRTAYLAASNADLVVEIDLELNEVTRLLPAGQEPDGMALVPRK